MNKILLFLCVVYITISSCSDNISPKEEYGKIQIKVIDATDNVPVSGAVCYTNPASHSIFLNFDGQYIMEDVLPGEYQIIVKKVGYITNTVTVRVIAGKSTKAELFLFDESFSNSPPPKPNLIKPLNNKLVNYSDVLLEWSCFDDDGDDLSYTIYLDEVNPPMNIIAYDLSESTYEVKNLKLDTKYYWYIVAKDKYGISPKSTTYSFTIDTSFVMDNSSIILDIPFNSNFSDYSKNSLITDCSYPRYAPDRKGIQHSSFEFNKNYITVKSNTLLNLTNNFSISLWLKPNANYGLDMVDNIAQIMGRMGSTGANTSSYGLCVNSDGKPLFQTYVNSIGTQEGICTSALTVNLWNHFVLTFSNQVITFYLNGKPVNTAQVQSPQTSTYDLYIGCRQTGNRYISGFIDDIKIFNKVITQQEINSLYKE